MPLKWQVARDLAQTGRGGVAVRDGELAQREGRVDRELRIVPRGAPLDGRVGVGGMLVEHVGDLAEHAEPVSEADRQVELAHALLVELHRLPLGVCGRAPAQVHRDVEDAPPRAAHELGNAGADVEVHAAHDAVAGMRMVVLNEPLVGWDAQLRVPLKSVGLAEEAPLVAVDVRLDEDQAGEAGGQGAHGGGGYRSMGRERAPQGYVALPARFGLLMPAGMSLRPPAPAPAESWRPAPVRPRLVGGAVHVWRADLTKLDDALIELLCESERARALRAREGRLWARGRGALRVLLGRYLACDPRTLRFTTERNGKPWLLFETRGWGAA